MDFKDVITNMIRNFREDYVNRLKKMQEISIRSTELLMLLNTYEVFPAKYVKAIHNRANGDNIDKHEVSNVFDAFNCMTETFTHDIEDNEHLRRKYLAKTELFTNRYLMNYREVA